MELDRDSVPVIVATALRCRGAIAITTPGKTLCLGVVQKVDESDPASMQTAPVAYALLQSGIAAKVQRFPLRYARSYLQYAFLFIFVKKKIHVILPMQSFDRKFLVLLLLESTPTRADFPELRAQ